MNKWAGKIARWILPAPVHGWLGAVDIFQNPFYYHYGCFKRHFFYEYLILKKARVDLLGDLKIPRYLRLPRQQARPLQISRKESAWAM